MPTGAEPARIGRGSRVRLDYRLLLASGEVFEDSGAQPLELVIGENELPAAIEAALGGLAAGETGAFEFAPFEVWGPHDPALLVDLPVTDFAATGAPQPGQVVDFALPDGRHLAGTVLTVEGEQARVDFNHPLHAHPVRVDVRILAVEPAVPADARTEPTPWK